MDVESVDVNALAGWARQRLAAMQARDPGFANDSVQQARQQAQQRQAALLERIAADGREAWLLSVYGVLRANPATWDHPDLPHPNRGRKSPSGRALALDRGALCDEDVAALVAIERAWSLLTAAVAVRAGKYERVDCAGADADWSARQLDEVAAYLDWSALCSRARMDLRPVMLLALEDIGLRQIEQRLRLRNGSALGLVQEALTEWHVMQRPGLDWGTAKR